MTGWLTFLLGLVCAIPLSVAANLMTGPVQRWLDRNRTRLSARRRRQLHADYELIKQYYGDRTQLHTDLLRTILFAVIAIGLLILYALSLFSGMVLISSAQIASYKPMVNLFSAPFSYVVNGVLLLALLFLVVMMSVVMQRVIRMTAMVRNVKSFTTYEANILNKLKVGRSRESNGTDQEEPH